MKRLIPLLALLALLAACDTQSERDRAEAQRLQAQAQLAQAQTQAAQSQALIDSQNGRIGDYQAILILAVILAAGSMAVSISVLLVLHKVARSQQPTVIYQIQAPQQAQLDDRYSWPEVRAQRRFAQLEAERKV